MHNGLNVMNQSNAYLVQLRNLNKLLFPHLSHSNFVSLWLEDMPFAKENPGPSQPMFLESMV